MNTNILYFLTFLIFIVFSSCSKGSKKTDLVSSPKKSMIIDNIFEISKEDFNKHDLDLIHLENYSLGKSVSSTGLIEVPPNGKAVVTAQIGGFVKNTPLLVGDKVKKGQFLMSIENIEFLEIQQQYLESKERLEYLKSEFERQKELYQEKITSEKSYLRSQSDYKSVEAMYLGLRKKLELLNIDPELVEKGLLSSEATIFSPISGDVTHINVASGSPVSPSDVIMEIVSTDHLHLELRVFEKDVLKLNVGQGVEFTIPESNSKIFKGEIHLIGKSIGKDRTVKVHVHIEEPYEAGFIPGMFVQAKIILEDKASVAIDKSAIIKKENQYYLLKLNQESIDRLEFKLIEIELGDEMDGVQLVRIPEGSNLDQKFLSGAGYLIE
ncbi:efflux RND transporter periplasmic adaptor subunit [Lutimonas zeaxanthinifaciens]|uniref:efflux RND transporter periplasmic adaptor subunit n=1 Tax=Lutimonas zeaxanthinifaciens TaxID=3060215 RepID=UPI00265D33B6|nr:efflux RND transporter periplasmic adaptor subunit [Lutimonas sp. YSD2104]WKK64629.1 efflux RND transporter periplasmic adaptor subunit [Lutimonas sp. YSD2104]